MVEHPLRELEVVGSNPGRAIPKALKIVPVATLLGAQHYKASIGLSPLTLIASLTSYITNKKPENNQWLYSTEDRMEDKHSC